MKVTITNLCQSATQALEGAKDSKTKLKIAEQYSKKLLEQIKAFEYGQLWSQEYKNDIYHFLIKSYTSKFLSAPSYIKLCNLYLNQISLGLKNKWEQIFDYRLQKQTLVLTILKKTYHIKLTPFNRFFIRHFLHFKNDVDLVYLWCDGTDVKWQKKRLRALKKANPNWTPNGLDKCRFTDNNELKYSLRSAQMYAPWIHKIYIITDGQTPKWLNTANKKIKIIDHKDIIEKKYLPTFNANVIDSSIHHIKGLSEYFLFGNDDTFFGQPLSKDFFFSADGKPYARLHKMPSIFKVVESPYLQSLVYMSHLHKENGGKTFLLNPHHNIDAYTKTMLRYTEKTFALQYKTWRQNQFRTNHDFQRIIAYYQAIDRNSAILKPQPSQHSFKSDSLFLRLGRKNVLKTLKKYQPKLFCINDNENTTDEDRKNVQKLYQKLFPYKSRFEK